MKYSSNTLELSHTLTDNLKPIPVHYLQNTTTTNTVARYLCIDVT